MSVNSKNVDLLEARIPIQSHGMRLDQVVAELFPDYSRNRLATWIKEGRLTVDGKTMKPRDRALASAHVVLEVADEPVIDWQPQTLPLDVIFEDEHILVVNKPAGMVVHPAHGNWSGTLVNGLVYHFENLPEMKGNVGRPGLVHRIDKDTSGLLVIAKTEETMAPLAAQFFHHTIQRTYLALVWGEPEADEGTIVGNVGRSAKDRKVMDVFPDGSQGKHAVTHWKVVKRLRYVSLVQCTLETGRTHQIRAHFKFLGHPLFNDAMYGGDKIRKGTQFAKYKSFISNCFDAMPRQALHAKSLGFVHPITNANLYFEAPIPSDFATVLEKWEQYVQVD